jgi:NAD+ kinase
MRILLVSKRTRLSQLAPSEVEHLESAGVTSRERLTRSHLRHLESLGRVRACLERHQVLDCHVDEVREGMLQGADLVVTIGGDGCVFALADLVGSHSVIAVNSDPERSVGTYTRCQASEFDDLFEAWRDGKAQFDALPRLGITTGTGRRRRFLNDCLFTSRNPAAMTRYRLEVGGQHAIHWSSGVWIATAQGRTGAIRSAGFSSTSEPAIDTPALLWMVRESYRSEGADLLSGLQVPPLGLDLITAIPGIALYLDGCHARIPLAPGERASIAVDPQTLNLVRK